MLANKANANEIVLATMSGLLFVAPEETDTFNKRWELPTLIQLEECY